MGTAFGILGELQVTQDGQLRDIGPLRQRGLLARLLIRGGQPVSAERLIEELWPERVPQTARHTLHVYISRIRRALGEDRACLESDSSGYRLRVEPESIDAARFEALAAAGRRALAEDEPSTAADLLREALALWRGPALVEFADEPFARDEAARLDQLRLATLEDRIGAELCLGLHGNLTEELRTLTLEQPYRETFWEQLMLALYRAGRQTEALHAFGEARTRLADDLGIEPGPALQRMEQRVLAQDPTLAATEPVAVPIAPATEAPSNLPLARTTFVGRERDLAVAGRLLAASRSLTLTGAPGAGKTRMALRLATDQRDRYPGGTLFVWLAGVSDGRSIVPAITTALDEAAEHPSPEGRSSDLADLATRLAGRPVLLVLDNLEQVTGAAGPIDGLLNAVPNLTVLATSRAPLGIIGEQEFPVLPLQVPPADAPADPSVIRTYDAVALLVTRARAADPGFEITSENAAAIAGITSRLDGLPLAIELGAGRLRALTPQGLLDRLERRLPLLEGHGAGPAGHHDTLRHAIAWSYELLAEDEQRLFRRLGVFVSGFSAEAAAAVADRPLDEAWAGIETLIAQSLLHRHVHLGDARFDMLETLREFALEQLEATGELEPTLSRHARYYLGLADVDAGGGSGEHAEATIATLLPELDEIGAALNRSTRGSDRETGLRLAGATWRLWQAVGRITEGREVLARLLDPPVPDAGARADALLALAGLEYWQADHAAAHEAYEEALAIYRAAGDRGREAEVLSAMSMNATWSGDPNEGARLASESRRLFEAMGDRARVGETAMAQGFALWQDRQYAAARPLWEEALAVSRELGADTLAVTQLAGLAGIEFHSGAADQATRIALDALDQACGLDNVGLCVWLLDFIAAYAVADRPADALRVAGAADALRTASGGGMRVEDLHIEPARTAAARTLGQQELEQAWAEGRELDLQTAIALARSLRPVSIG